MHQLLMKSTLLLFFYLMAELILDCCLQQIYNKSFGVNQPRPTVQLALEVVGLLEMKLLIFLTLTNAAV